MKYHERARAILRSGLRSPLRLTLLALSDHADKEGVCFPSIDTLGHETGLSRRSVQEAIRDLVASRVLERTEQLGVRTTYRLQLGALPTAERKPKRIRPPRTPRTPAGGAPVQEAHPPGAAGAPVGVQEARGGVQEAHPNGSVTSHLDGPVTSHLDARVYEAPTVVSDQLPAKARVRTLLSTVWEAIQRLYVDSGHGHLALDLDSCGRRQALEKCLRALHADPLTAARMTVHLLAYWLYGPNDFWRLHRKGSQLVASLLRPTEIGVRYTEAESWVWDGEVRARAGPSPPVEVRRQSNASRQISELLRELEDDYGDQEGHPESDPEPPSLRLLQPAP